ncbi:MAG: class 3 adenylate cyclase/tetratricopeptide (TPR) repeat protein [Roseivirga sp.]|jgi:class 3 adenylate cyclase/tetratricopeptide (TPR) repeat protein
MKNLLLTILILFSGISLKAETKLDSIFTVWQDETQADTSRLQAIHKFILQGYIYNQPDSAYYFAQKQLDFAERKGLSKYIALALTTQGLSLRIRGDYPNSLVYHKKSMLFYEEIGDKTGIAGALVNIGNLYAIQSNFDKALEYFEQGASICEEIGETYFLANATLNIGSIYQMQGEYTRSLKYFLKSLKIYQENQYKTEIADAQYNIGGVYEEDGDFPKALDFYLQSLESYEELEDKYGITFSLVSIGNVYFKQGLTDDAISQCEKSLNFAKEINSIDRQEAACICLYDVYKAIGNDKSALKYHEQMLILSDSLQAEETNLKLQKMDFQKRMLADSMATVERERLVQEEHQEEVKQKNQIRNMLVGGGVLILIIASGIYSRLRYTNRAKKIIEKEKERSENLLLNILPANIAAELKEKGRAEAREFEMVSTLFSDFKGFTAASEKLSAQELVAEINTCFEAFDNIMGKYNIEKIKTIGDAYMAAGGLPVPSDGSAKNTVLAALEMQAFISARKIKMDTLGKPAFEMRVGIHTGPVVAGIVGVKKFQYDIWGDTVNTASRMESSGGVGKVNISQATYELLKNDLKFIFESRGKIEAKGKGEMEMWFVSMNSQ